MPTDGQPAVRELRGKDLTQLALFGGELAPTRARHHLRERVRVPPPQEPGLFHLTAKLVGMTEIPIRIPPDIRFADLNLARDPRTGAVSFDSAPILQIAEASGVDPLVFLNNDEAMSTLLVEWYAHAQRQGEPPDALTLELLEEARLENLHGGGLSFPVATNQ